MKKLPWLLAVFFSVTTFLLLYFFVFKGDVLQVSDTRVAVQMTQAEKDFVLEEMRAFLENTQQIYEGILEEDIALISSAAIRSGSGVKELTPKGLVRKLPFAFKQLGFSAHAAFDAIARDAQTGFNKAHTQQQVNNLLKKCIACHKTYQIKVVD